MNLATLREDGFAGYVPENENQEGIAMSTNPTTWPNFWPDKLGDINDPGWKNEWNGFFGKDIQNCAKSKLATSGQV